MFVIGKVVSIEDDKAGDRIRVRLPNSDKNVDEVQYAFPLLPKHLHIKPKVGEAVMVFSIGDNPKANRFYVGPIISQPQRMNYDSYDYTAMGLVGGNAKILPTTYNNASSLGSLATDDDIAIYGRKNSDIILGEDDVRIRCGVRLTDDKKDKLEYNRSNPSFIKLKYHSPLITADSPSTWDKTQRKFLYTNKETVESSANIVAQKINLISTASLDPFTKVNSTDIKYPASKNKGNENLTDEELLKFINTAHPMVYGDELLNFLSILVNAFINHTHRFHQMTPVQDDTYNALMKYNMDNLLSKNIKIN